MSTGPDGVPPQKPAAAYPPDPTEPSAPPTLPDGGISQTLIQLLQLSPLTDLYRRNAERERRVREWVCFWGDAVLRVIVYAFLLFVLAVVTRKVLDPIPDMWPFG